MGLIHQVKFIVHECIQTCLIEFLLVSIRVVSPFYCILSVLHCLYYFFVLSADYINPI